MTSNLCEENGQRPFHDASFGRPNVSTWTQLSSLFTALRWLRCQPRNENVAQFQKTGMWWLFVGVIVVNVLWITVHLSYLCVKRLSSRFAWYLYQYFSLERKLPETSLNPNCGTQSIAFSRKGSIFAAACQRCHLKLTKKLNPYRTSM